MKSNTHLKLNNMSNPELLSPAGDIQKAKIALLYGADAIFLGAKQFSLRARSSNFTYEEISEIVKFAHSLNKKVYIVSNIICKNSMIPEIRKYLDTINNIKPDGLIVSDPSIIQIIKQSYPDLQIHISTQQSTTNSKAALFWKRNKATRVVLSRELTITELELLINNLNKSIEIEVFIHGAVCIAYSGRCMMSNHFSLRDSNIGGCAQSCRWTYEVLNFDIPNKDKYFTMSAKDMIQIDYINKLKELGVASLKIEGRMKSYHYIATVTNAYSNILKNSSTDNIKFFKNELKQCANRDFDTAFMDGKPGFSKMLYHDEITDLKQSYILDIISMNQDGSYNCIVRNNFSINDKIQILSPNLIFETTINYIIDKTTNTNLTICPTPMQEVIIKFNDQFNLSCLSFGRKLTK